jgi:TonB-linked SusC/RagA family outer membrane protein
MRIKNFSVPIFALIIGGALPSIATAQSAKKTNPAEDTTILHRKSDLDSVVVVAYGTQKKGAITGAVVQVSSKDLAKRSLTSVTDALIGSAPGIQGTLTGGQPGSSPNLRIRGAGSISGSNSPLIVVDGVVYDGDIASINPDDIATMTTLLDAASSALYGSRGANGVIMLTTKKGSRSAKRPSVRLKVFQGYNQQMLPDYSHINAYDYYPVMWEYVRNGLISSQGGLLANQIAKDTIKSMLGYNPFNVGDHDIVDINGKLNPNAKLLYGDDLNWKKASTRRGYHQDYGATFSGGNEFADYYASVGYVSDKGFTPNADFKRWNARVNANAQLSPRIKTGLNVYGSTSSGNQVPLDANAPVNPFYFARTIGPIYPVHKHDASGAYVLDTHGNKIYDDGINSYAIRPFAGGRNALQENLLNENYSTGYDVGARGNLDVSIIKDLTFKSTLGIDQGSSNADNYLNPIIGDGAPAGSLTFGTATLRTYSFNQIFNYAKHIGLHSFDAMVGHENNDYKSVSASQTVSGQIFPNKNLELGNYSTVGTPTSATTEKRVESYFSGVNYNYDGRFYASLSGRRDGNSSFDASNRWANFWSAGGSWLVSKEKFFHVSFIDELRVKASYGKVGNDAIGNYPYQGGYTINNNAQESGYIMAKYDNPNITWESGRSLNTGIEFSVFKHRLSGYMNYYDKVSSGMVFAVPLPLSAGGTPDGTYNIWKNVGSMYNRGVELSLTAALITKRDMNWQVTFNASSNKNKITKMPTETPEVISGTKKLAVGHSIYDYWLPAYRGVDAANGDALYDLDPSYTYNEGAYFDYPDKTINGKQYTTVANRAKYEYVGSAMPKLQGSIRNNFDYKRFSFSFVTTYQVGGLMYDKVYATMMSPQLGQSVASDIKNSWHNVGDQTNIPRMDQGHSADLNASSSRWLIDASYFTINNINFGYTLDPKMFERLGLKVGSVQPNLTIENLYHFSARKGMNASQSFNGVTSDGFGPRRAVTMGVFVNM